MDQDLSKEASGKVMTDLGTGISLARAIGSAADAILSYTDDRMVRMVSHFDADGISSAALLSHGLERLGFRPHVSMLKGIKAETMASIAREEYNLVILSDMGSSALVELGQVASAHPSKRIIILDHHKVDVPDGFELPPNIFHINCRKYGMDGGREACASTMSFLLMYYIDPKANMELVKHMVCGLVGDKQDRDGISGLNKAIIEKAESRGVLKITVRSALWSGPLSEALEMSVTPLIMALRSEDARSELLEKLGFTGDERIGELDSSRMRFLTSTLALHLLKQGVRPEVIKRLTRPTFISGSGTDLVELSHMIDSCGRENEMSTGLLALNGRQSSLERARTLHRNFALRVREAIMEIHDHGVSESSSFYYFYCSVENSSIGGTLAELVMDYIVPKQMPVISLSPSSDGKEYQISARGTRELVERGLDLSVALREASVYCQGSGGGHPIASGATIPHHLNDEFITKLEELLSKQVVWEGS